MGGQLDWGKIANRSVLIVLLTGVLGCSARAGTDLPVNDPTFQSFLVSWDRERRPDAVIESYPNVLNLLNTREAMLALYREDVTSQAVKEFFIRLTGSPETALPILYHADRYNVPLSLAFALTWVESRYSVTAVNRNATSVDRGLWQLNSLSFAHLREEDFFNPDVNSSHGAAYLRRSLDLASDERTALAIYNAGLTRVRRNEIPPSTQRYVERVTGYQHTIEAQFRRYILNRFPPDAV